MNQFEKQYYEDESFWSDQTLGTSNQIRIKETSRLIPADVRTLLDVGCGNGIFCNYLNETHENLQITGIDRSKTALQYVKTDKKLGSITDLPFNDNSFDCVSCLQVLEHMTTNDFDKALSELSRVSAKYLLISVPYNENIEQNFTKCPKCKSNFNSDLHLRTFSMPYFEGLFNQFGFKFIQSLNTIKHVRPLLLVYINLLRAKKKKDTFNSPICPICGYKNADFAASYNTESLDQTKTSNKRLKSKIKEILFAMSPKVKEDGYWVIGLFEKIN